MKLLHRYLLRELLSPALLGLLVFTFVLMLESVFEVIDLILQPGVELGTVAQVFVCLIPTVMSVTIPMAVLVACLLSFGRLATDREVMAMRASGLHIVWLVWPALALGLAISLALLWANMTVMPRVALQTRDLTYQLVFQTVTSIEPGQAYDDFSAAGAELEFMFERRGEGVGTMRGVFIHSEKSEPTTGETRQLYLVARAGRIEPDVDNRAIRIVLSDGTMHVTTLGGEQDALREIRFARMEQWIRPELQRVRGGRVVQPPAELTRAEIKREIERSTDSERIADLRVDLLFRWVFPFSTLAFMLIGVPLGIVTKAAGKGLGLGLSFLLILLYYGLLEWGKAMVESGQSWGGLAMWSPNIMLGALGCALLRWVSRQ